MFHLKEPSLEWALKHLTRFYASDFIKAILPARVHQYFRAYHDVKLKKVELDVWGGPFTGQLRRQELFKELVRSAPFEAIVETGTYRGDTTVFFAQFGIPVHTVETQTYEHYVSCVRLRKNKNVNLSLGDSRSFLNRLKQDQSFPRKRVVFYLDAHWFEELPLGEEFDIIASHWSESVIIIDDFKVPDDPGYQFDDYGPGKVICLEYLMDYALGKFQVFFPAANSPEETGFKRGCAIFVTRDDMLNTIGRLNLVRRWRVSDAGRNVFRNGRREEGGVA
jgi:hypothetical protein